MTALVEWIGRFVIDVLEEAGRSGILMVKVLATLRRRPYYIRQWFEQMLDVGVRSLPIVMVTAIFSGAVFALQTWEGFEQYGTTSLVGSVVALAITREMVPVMASVMVSGRAGSAMAAEIGTMVVTEQVDALRTMAVDPVEYLVVPRVVATAFMLPLRPKYSTASERTRQFGSICRRATGSALGWCRVALQPSTRSELF